MIKTKVYFWPQWFAAAWPGQQKRRLPATLIKKLNRANLYLWRALNFYDDFLDGSGRPTNLPRANSAYRHFLEIYYRLNLSPNFYKLFNRIISDLDKANRQEIQNQRCQIVNGKIILNAQVDFLNLTDLSRKSLALGLGPLAILSALDENNDKINQTLNFFRLALAAKQLADDAKDWLEDLKNGRLTAANFLVLKAAKKRGLTLDLKQKPEIAYLLFALEASPILSKNLQTLCRLSRQAAAQIPLPPAARLIKEIIGPLETGLKETEHFRSLWLKTAPKML